jgi:uncharacterized protein (DUF302 family)
VILTRSRASYADTVAALLAAIERHNLTVFARIDHAGGARAAGLELADEEVIVFGNPAAGTPLMQSDPRIGIELPLRMLVWSDGEHVVLGYTDPRKLAATYEVSDHATTLDQMAGLLETLAAEAVSP